MDGVQPANFEFRRYEHSDRQALLEFRAVHYGARAIKADAAYVDWLYGDAPGARGKGIPLFVCKAGDDIVGTEGHIHVGLKVGAELLEAAWTVDLAVRADMRRGQGPGGVAIGSSIVRVSREHIGIRLAMHATQASTTLARRRFGWVPLGVIPLWGRPLDVATLLRVRDLPKAIVSFSRTVQIFLDVLERRAAGERRAQRITLVPTPLFDERTDQVWSAVSPSYRVACRRDYAYIGWRFDRFVGSDAYSRFWLRQNGLDIGYAVLRFGTNRGARVGILVDYFCQPAHASAMFSGCLDIVRDAGGVALHCALLTPAAGRLLRPLGFARRSGGWSFLVSVTGLSDRVRETMTTRSNWFITAGDSNVDHRNAV